MPEKPPPPERLLEAGARPRASGGIGAPVEFRKGNYSHAAPAKTVEALGLPHPHDWHPTDADWRLPSDWKQIVHAIRLYHHLPGAIQFRLADAAELGRVLDTARTRAVFLFGFSRQEIDSSGIRRDRLAPVSQSSDIYQIVPEIRSHDDR